ncbi:MAG: hypothetical protein P8L37_06690, partial [Phycisphaerales bacterium]|nr:hypothetical protein [Phycisphaerales bacterium]
MNRLLSIVLATCLAPVHMLFAGDLATAFTQAGANRTQIELAIASVPADERAGMEWLVTHMPEEDLRTLDAEFLVENCNHAYEAWRTAPWHDQISETMFFESILPYAS